MKKYIIILLFLCAFGSCDYLDVVPDNVATIEYAFRNRASAEKFLHTCYSYLPQQGSLDFDVAMSAGDECWTHSYIGWQTRNLAESKQNSTTPYLNFWNNEGGATQNLWQGIRDCNIFLEKLGSVEDIPQYEKTRWLAEVKFLKAFYHFYLFRMYGPIPIVDKNIDVSSDVNTVKVYRDPVDDVVKYIADLMLEAANELPDESEIIEGTEAGRINNLIAMGTRAQVYVYAASPLFNGNSVYAEMIDNRGVQLFPQTYDETKWKTAANACKEAIDMCHEQGKELYDLVDPIISNAPEPLKLQTTYRQAITERWNKELIWGSVNYDCNFLSRESQAKIMRFSATHINIMPEWGPTLKMIDMYYSKNGVPIDEDAEWQNQEWYANRYKMRPEPSSGDEIYYVKEGMNTVNLHYNREPRFYASIGFDRGVYFGNGYYDFPANVKHLEYFAKEHSGLSSATQGFSITGYNVKKMHSYKNAVSFNTNAVEFYPFPVMRLADLYLMYAEALNESDGPVDEVFTYIDKVRERGGLAGVKDSWSQYSTNPTKPDTKDGMREIIQQERNIELAFEGKRFWDLRRWKQIATFNEQPQGWNASGEDATDFYRIKFVSTTTLRFTAKDYFWPIKEQELIVNRNLIQNYGW